MFLKRVSSALANGKAFRGNGKRLGERNNGGNAIEFIGHRNQGILLSREERWHEAIGSFQKAAEVKPNDAKTRYNLAIAYVRVDDIAAALSEYERLQALDGQLAGRLYQEIYQRELSSRVR